jgi:hypothetical protein
MTTSAAELELLKLAKLKPYKRGDRQAFLTDLLNGCDKTLDAMSKIDANKAYDALSVEAKEWYQSCIDRQDANPEAELPEFELETEDEDEEEDERADADDNAADGDGGDALDIPFNADDDEPVAKKRPGVLQGAKAKLKAKPKAPEAPGRSRFAAKKPEAKPEAARPRGWVGREIVKEKQQAGKPAAAAAANGKSALGKRGQGMIEAAIPTLWKHPSDSIPNLRLRLEKKNIMLSEVTIGQTRRDLIRSTKFFVAAGLLPKNPFV